MDLNCHAPTQNVSFPRISVRECNLASSNISGEVPERPILILTS